MDTQANLSISDFARLSGVSRQTLIYYDKIGLFSPDTVDSLNGYRYYSYRQLDVISVIYALKEIGTPLKEIKVYLDERTPERMVTLFKERKAKIDEEIRSLRYISKMMESRIRMTENSYAIDTTTVELHYLPPRQLLVSGDVSMVQDEDAMWETLLEFYEQCNLYNISYVYPLGDIVSLENLLLEEWHYPDRYFAVIEEPISLEPVETLKTQPQITLRPAGLYITGYIRGDYDAVDKLYERLYQYTKSNHLEITGNGYRESILDEVAVRSTKDYLFRVDVGVE